MINEKKTEIENSFATQLEHHLEGLITKIKDDFCEKSFKAEIRDLESNSLYSKFGLASKEYALIRKVGRISISVGRRLGEIYDKIPRLIAQNAFNIPENKIAPKMGGKLILDTCISFDVIDAENRKHVINVTKNHTKRTPKNGVGIEIRYNFNPNDSSRLRKDVDMAGHIIKAGLLPIYLVFSSISPRDEAIARLKRAGWIFLVGPDALAYTKELYQIDMLALLETDRVKSKLKGKIAELMKAMFLSHAFQLVVKDYSLKP